MLPKKKKKNHQRIQLIHLFIHSTCWYKIRWIQYLSFWFKVDSGFVHLFKNFKNLCHAFWSSRCSTNLKSFSVPPGSNITSSYEVFILLLIFFLLNIIRMMLKYGAIPLKYNIQQRPHLSNKSTKLIVYTSGYWTAYKAVLQILLFLTCSAIISDIFGNVELKMKFRGFA